MKVSSDPPGQCTECGNFAVLEEENGSRICMDCGAVQEDDND